MRRLLQNPRTEVFINVMLDSSNRFLAHPNPEIQQQIVDLFGTSEAINVAQTVNRIPELRQLYMRQLQRHARFVRYFEMCNEYDRTLYCLFFAGNHRMGHIRMKEAFWKIDSQGGYRFSDRTDPQQTVLFIFDPAQDLARLLADKYVGKTRVVEDVIHFVEDETAFIASQAKSALQWLEQNGQLTVAEIKSDGAKRRKGTFSNE